MTFYILFESAGQRTNDHSNDSMNAMILFFLISLFAFGEPRDNQHDIKRDGNFKRATGGRDVVGEELARLVRQATANKFSFRIGQYGVLYLHPAGQGNNALVYLNQAVRTFMTDPASRFTVQQVGITVDHLSRGSNYQTNFAVAGKDQSIETEGIGHSEQLLLRHLDTMLTYTRANTTANACPSHIVIYTLNAPCFWAGKDPTGCTERIFRSFDGVRSFRCRGANTQYVVGYRNDPSDAVHKANWTKGKRYLETRGITVVRIDL